MKIFLFVFTCAVFLVPGSQEVSAQPGCRYSYPISLDCPDISSDTVVLGRVVRLTDIDRETGIHSDAKDLGGWPQGKVVVEVEEVFKGSADTFIEFTLDGSCYGPIKVGSKFIVSLYKTPNGYSNPHWGDVSYMEPSERNKFLNALRALIRGERLSKLFGTVRGLDGLGPIEGITVIAEKDGQKFEAVTDTKGRYDFRDLPDGEYKVQPLLAPALRPAEIDQMRHAKPGDSATVDRGTLCGVRMDFLAQHAGVISGYIEGPDGKPFDVSTATLWRFDKEAKISFRLGQPEKEPGVFSFVNLPPGRYMIQVISRANGRSTSFYYPGVIYETDTQMIDLTVGQELTGLVFRIPPH
jgi:carboxypeptidase family protein